jgi:hypothetical protein
LGQQVVYRVRIFRGEDVLDTSWLEPLSFPSFRAEWLPGRSPDREIARIGSHFLVYEERRALFPLRPGTLTIPAATLRCTVAEGGKRREVIAAVASTAVTVKRLPEADRPANFSGVVGRVEALATAGQQRVRLGESIPLTVTLLGRANVWRARPSLVERLGSSRVDVFTSPANLSLDPGERLKARLSLRYEIVPRVEGRLRIPPLAVPYFDPELERFAVAETPVIEVVVEARARVAPSSASPAPAEREAPGAASPEARSAARPSRSSWLRWILAGGLLLLAGDLLRRRLRRLARLEGTVSKELGKAERADRLGETSAATAALARAIRVALERRVPGSQALAAEEILARTGDDPPARAAAELLVSLERLRFATGHAARPSDLPVLADVRRLLRTLEPGQAP